MNRIIESLSILTTSLAETTVERFVSAKQK